MFVVLPELGVVDEDEELELGVVEDDWLSEELVLEEEED